MLPESQNKIDQICEILKNFIPLNEATDPTSKTALLKEYFNPPAYIVRFLLLKILHLKDRGIADKSLWGTSFKYKNYLFEVSDWKGSWCLYGPVDRKKEIPRIGLEVQNKITKAVKVLDGILSNKLRSKVKMGDFSLQNVYHKLSGIYHFYEKEILDTEKQYNSSRTSDGKMMGLVTHIARNHDLKSKISNYSFALIVSFFSLLEFMLDAIYSFERPTDNFWEYKKMDFKERFKLVFPVNKDAEAKGFYDEFIKIRERYRNPLAHGLLRNEEDVLVSLDVLDLGLLSMEELVPLSYEYLSNKINYGNFCIKDDDAVKVIDSFRGFIKFLEKNKPYSFYIQYLQAGFPVPMNKEKIDEIKKTMTTPYNFSKYLEARSDTEDRIINRDI